MLDAGQHKERLRTYFDGIGFERWSAIYGQSKISVVRESIRDGHRLLLEQADAWLDQPVEATFDRAQALDAGCGTGLFSIDLARHGFRVTAVDLAPQMVAATRRAATAAQLEDQVTAHVGDLESLEGSYDLVACLDVLVHYPPESFARLCKRLGALCRRQLLFTYAPHSPLLAALHRLAHLFPKGQRRMDIQMIRDAHVDRALEQAGMVVCRRQRISKGFYHVTLLEARPGA